MPTVSTYVDVDVEADEFDDYEIIEEFFQRMRREEFKSMVEKLFADEYKEIQQKFPQPLPNHLAVAEEYYNRQQYKEALVHLERAVGWRGLADMRLTK